MIPVRGFRFSLLLSHSIVLLAAMLLTGAPVQAQQFTDLHSFTGGSDGANPYAGLIMDTAGSLYGTTSNGGSASFGTVFELSQSGGGWTEQALYSFAGGSDGANPYAGLIMDAAGSLYGTTYDGGSAGAGTVFKLSQSGGGWTEQALYSFAGGSDGANPYAGLTMDAAGSLYGTTYNGGSAGFGTIFKLSQSGGGWTEQVLYSFAGGSDGANPYAGLIMDAAGGLYGTTMRGGSVGDGTVFKLSQPGGGWTEQVLHSFAGGSDGAIPQAGLIMDTAGNLYGTTSGPIGNGTVFKLSQSGGGWTEQVLHIFTGVQEYPLAGLIMDTAGSLYGTTSGEGFDDGTVFKLSQSGGSWIELELYRFSGGSDGANPTAGLIMDAAGYLYGTAPDLGPGGYGTVYQLSPTPSQFTPMTPCRLVDTRQVSPIQGGSFQTFNLPQLTQSNGCASLTGATLCPWTKTTLHAFVCSADGAYPANAPIFDASGNLYGTTALGGTKDDGVVYELLHSGSSWVETPLYDFDPATGGYPIAGLIFDHAGNLYGAAAQGGPCCGIIYELTPSGSGWTEHTLHSFQGQNDGGDPTTTLTLAPSGEIYGATGGDPNPYDPGNGTVFELTPSNGGWAYNLIYNLPAFGPYAGFTMDAAGNLYGVDRFGQGPTSIFKLTPSGNGWIYATLYNFTCGQDGCLANTLLAGPDGNLYGTASGGGAYGKGTVWEITP